jgi:hypothetical protein
MLIKSNRTSEREGLAKYQIWLLKHMVEIKCSYRVLLRILDMKYSLIGDDDIFIINILPNIKYLFDVYPGLFFSKYNDVLNKNLFLELKIEFLAH